jgi:ABC-type multidrug transport system ATPase subunit
MTQEQLLQIRSGEKSYGGRVVLRIPDLSLRIGERLLVQGENGTGKSTFLRILVGLSRFDRGSLHRFAGWHSLKIGYLPQQGGIYGDLSIEENSRALQRLLGRPAKGEHAAFVSSKLGLNDLLTARVDSLSGGYRRLAAIYCIFNTAIDAAVLDEPLASLDRAKQAAVASLLVDLQDSLKITVICDHEDNFPPDQPYTLTQPLMLIRQ